MYMLLWIALLHGVVSPISLGEYETLEECLYNLHEAEVMINEPWEGMVCVKDIMYVTEADMDESTS